MGIGYPPALGMPVPPVKTPVGATEVIFLKVKIFSK